MKLTRFRVTNFRSVVDSGWIDVDDVTALIGVNESGKSNLLLALWKLKPANEGHLEPTSDYPKNHFADVRSKPEQYAFIKAEFDAGESATWIGKQAGIPAAAAAKVCITRFLDARYMVEFPCHRQNRAIETKWLADKLSDCIHEISSGEALKQESPLQIRLVDGLRNIEGNLPPDDEIGIERLTSIKDEVSKFIPRRTAKTSTIVPLLRRFVEEVKRRLDDISADAPGDRANIKNLVVKALPSFVYYAHYGNLDSEIYLPHVVDNLEREDLGTKEMAKARTLRVLFSFVGLEAQEILELGSDYSANLASEQAVEIGERKKERSILLQSASAKLTGQFRDWWRQGDHRFRFEADGNHFRIWVADDRRPTEVELENRSSGLQWFLSFYLVFLVESQEDHSGAILLLDEPGMSLHPHAQRDLSDFFNNLSENNQLLYTSHSPFLIDPDRLERARKVFVAKDGSTKATSDLGHTEGEDVNAGAAYAVHSALNLSVGESILVGCRPVLVEGASDQHYLTAIKSLLVANGAIKPSREIVFVPSGGASNIRVVAGILAGRDGKPPTVLLDADRAGAKAVKALTSDNGLYAGHREKVLSMDKVADDVGEGAEVEDLLPPKLLAKVLDGMLREGEVRLQDEIENGVPFVEQVRSWATSQSVVLRKHWKVELARRVKERVVQRSINEFDEPVAERWSKLFAAFEV